MTNVKNRLIALLGTFGLTLGLLLVAPTVSVGGAPPTAVAEAGNCSAPGVCGRIHNRSGYATTVIRDWGGTTYRSLCSGCNSEAFWADTDGFFVPNGSCRKLYAWSAGDGSYIFYGNKYQGRHKVIDVIYGNYYELRRC